MVACCSLPAGVGILAWGSALLAFERELAWGSALLAGVLSSCFAKKKVAKEEGDPEGGAGFAGSFRYSTGRAVRKNSPAAQTMRTESSRPACVAQRLPREPERRPGSGVPLRKTDFYGQPGILAKNEKLQCLLIACFGFCFVGLSCFELAWGSALLAGVLSSCFAKKKVAKEEGDPEGGAGFAGSLRYSAGRAVRKNSPAAQTMRTESPRPACVAQRLPRGPERRPGSGVPRRKTDFHGQPEKWAKNENSLLSPIFNPPQKPIQARPSFTPDALPGPLRGAEQRRKAGGLRRGLFEGRSPEFRSRPAFRVAQGTGVAGTDPGSPSSLATFFLAKQEESTLASKAKPQANFRTPATRAKPQAESSQYFQIQTQNQPCSRYFGEARKNEMPRKGGTPCQFVARQQGGYPSIYHDCSPNYAAHRCSGGSLR